MIDSSSNWAGWVLAEVSAADRGTFVLLVLNVSSLPTGAS